MAKIEDCPGFETFGADVKAARKAKQLSRSALADMIHCDSRYLANIENEGTLPSLPVVIQLIKICGLAVNKGSNCSWLVFNNLRMTGSLKESRYNTPISLFIRATSSMIS